MRNFLIQCIIVLIFWGGFFSCQSLKQSIRKAEEAIGSAKKIGSDEYAKEEIGEAVHLLEKALTEQKKKPAIVYANTAEDRANQAYHQTLQIFIKASLKDLEDLKETALKEHANILEKEGFSSTEQHHTDLLTLGAKLESWVPKIFGLDKEVLDKILKVDLESESAIFLEEIDFLMNEYNELIQLAKNRTKNILQNLDSLDKEINNTTNDVQINQKSVAKARSLRKIAKERIDDVDYPTAEKNIQDGLRAITRLPIVKFSLEPAIFSPDGDAYHDQVIFMSSVDTPNPIVSWEIKVFDKVESITKHLSKKKKSFMIVVKHFSGNGLPPMKLKWNGKLDGNVFVSSAKRYLVELSVTDDKDGIGHSILIDLKTDVFVVPTSRGLLIDIPDIQFALNSARLSSRYYSVLKKVYKKILDYPGASLIVEGHTDFLGTAEHNLALSKRRAISVMNYLQKKGISASKIETKGFGESLPQFLEEEKSPLNRRVSFIILRNNGDKNKYENFLSKLVIETEFKYPKQKIEKGLKSNSQ